MGADGIGADEWISADPSFHGLWWADCRHVAMGDAPWGMTYMHPNGQSGMQPGMPTSPFMMPLPASPHHSEQANIGDEAAVEKDGKMVDGSPQGSDTTNAFGMPPVDISE